MLLHTTRWDNHISYYLFPGQALSGEPIFTITPSGRSGHYHVTVEVTETSGTFWAGKW